MLVGHTTGLDDSYYRPPIEDQLNEYLLAVNNLTINEENRLKLKLEEEKTKNEQTLQKLTSEIDSIKEAMARVIAKGEVKPL